MEMLMGYSGGIELGYKMIEVMGYSGGIELGYKIIKVMGYTTIRVHS